MKLLSPLIDTHPFNPSLYFFSLRNPFQVKELSEELEATKAELSEKTTRFMVVQGEVEGLKSALAGASAKASELSSLAEKAGQVRFRIYGDTLRSSSFWDFIDRSLGNP